MVSQMSHRSFVLLIMYITVHVQQHSIWYDMFCCEFREVSSVRQWCSHAITVCACNIHL